MKIVGKIRLLGTGLLGTGLLLGMTAMGRGQALPRADLDNFLTAHCGDCHLAGANEGGLELDALGSDLGDPAVFAVWERVHDRVQAGEMPPQDAAQSPVPDDQRAAFVTQLRGPLYAAHQARAGTVYRRLNRREFQNTLNDMFGTEVELVSRLPEDGRYHEFDNVGQAQLGISLVHMQQYMQAADDVMRAAMATTQQPPSVVTISANYAETREGEQHIGKVWKKLSDNSVVFFRQLGYPTGMLAVPKFPFRADIGSA